MISKLMQMEERIVLDGAVAPVIADAGAGIDGAQGAGVESADVAVDPVGSVDDLDSSGSSGGNDPLVGSVESGQSDDVDAGLDGVVEALDGVDLGSAAGDVELKALIVNTDIDDIQDLIDAAGDGVLVVTFDGNTDNLQGLINELETLSGGKEFSSIGIVAHGTSEGELVLTALEQVSAESLGTDVEQREFFAALGGLMSEDGRIDLISCDSGAGDLGDDLMAAIAGISGAEVAASIDETGSEGAGGDWHLEKGDVDVVSEYFDGDEISDFDGVLPSGHFDLGILYENTGISGEQGAIYIDFFGNVRNICTSGYIAIVDSASGGDQVNIELFEADLASKFMLGNKIIKLDLEEIAAQKGVDFIEGVEYKLSITDNFYERNSDNFANNEVLAFLFTVAKNGITVNFPHNNPTPTDGGGDGGDNTGDLGGLVGDIIEGLENGDTQGVIDAIGEIAGGDGLSGEEGGSGDDGGEGGSDGDGEDGGEQAGTGADSGAPSGEPNNMMVQNPFSEIITSQEVQALFDSTIDAFAGLGMDAPGIYAMIQDAMGDTMTTASLVASCEQILDDANLLLAEVVDVDGGEVSLSGGGMTAETEEVASVIQNAIDSMVQARGNALIANDLLRILALNIGDFTERLAENSFSAGVSRLAVCNEELAYSYEILNGLCKVVKEYKDLGKPLSVAQLNGMMPEIIASAKSTAGGIADNGDRASKDVLAFLTRQMQNNGVDKDNLQNQVSAVFKQWHNSLGLSEPINVSQDLNIDVASGGFAPSEAM